MKTCGRCGADVPGAEAMAVEALTVAGTRLCSVLCPDCGRVLAAGKFPGVSMWTDGKLEAVPSAPAGIEVRYHRHGLLDNPDPFEVQPPLANRSYDFFEAGGARVHVEGPGVLAGDAGLPLPDRVPEMPPVHPPRAAGEYTCTVERQPDGRLTIRVRDPQGQVVEEFGDLEDNITDAGIRERLAAYAHEAWAGWMRHLFERAVVIVNRDDGCNWTAIPKIMRDRWARQMETPYSELPEAEKASDRAQADRILAILRGEA